MNILHVGSTQTDVDLYIQCRLHLITVIEKTVKIKIQNFKNQIWHCIYHIDYRARTNVIYYTPRWFLVQTDVMYGPKS